MPFIIIDTWNPTKMILTWHGCYMTLSQCLCMWACAQQEKTTQKPTSNIVKQQAHVPILMQGKAILKHIHRLSIREESVGLESQHMSNGARTTRGVAFPSHWVPPTNPAKPCTLIVSSIPSSSCGDRVQLFWIFLSLTMTFHWVGVSLDIAPTVTDLQ